MVVSRSLLCFSVILYTTQTIQCGLLTEHLKVNRRPVKIKTRYSPVTINFNSGSRHPLAFLSAKPPNSSERFLPSSLHPVSRSVFPPFRYPHISRLPVPVLPMLPYFFPQFPLPPVLPPIVPPFLPPLYPFIPPLLPPPLMPLMPRRLFSPSLLRPLPLNFIGRPLNPIKVPILGKKTPLEKLLWKLRSRNKHRWWKKRRRNIFDQISDLF